MMNSFSSVLADNLKKAKQAKKSPTFRPGDTLRVEVKVVEGDKSRLQAFEGICIARKNAGIGSSFTVRKLSYGEGVERTFPLFSPMVDSVEVVRMGKVRRAKLYYLKGRKGKSARIAEEFRSVLAMKGDEIATAAHISEEKIAEVIAKPEAVAEAKPEVKSEAPAQAVAVEAPDTVVKDEQKS